MDNIPAGNAETYVESFDGTPLRYVVAGEGVPLMIVDGLACNHFVFPYYWQDFSHNFKTLAWHYRGHCESGIPSDMSTLTIGHLAEDMKTVADAAGFDQFLVLSYSMGTQVSLEFMNRYPERVQALISLSGTLEHPMDIFRNFAAMKYLYRGFHWFLTRDPIAHSPALRPIWKVMMDNPMSLRTSYKIEMDPRMYKPMYDSMMRSYFHNLGNMDPLVLAHVSNGANQHSARSYLGGIKVPTLLIHGDGDRMSPIKATHEMHAGIPDSEFLLVRGGTHMAYIEQPDLINLRVRKFLEAHGFLKAEPARSSVAKAG